jgi:hypothetical protein
VQPSSVREDLLLDQLPSGDNPVLQVVTEGFGTLATMETPLERDTLFRKLRGKPENKVGACSRPGAPKRCQRRSIKRLR